MPPPYTIYEFVNDQLLRTEAEKFILTHLAKGILRPRIDRSFPLSKIVDAPRYLESNQQVGMVVVTISESSAD